MKIVLSILFVILLPYGKAFGDYCSTGTFTGTKCKGFIIESCSMLKIEAVAGDDEVLRNLKRCYKNVSEYSNGRCNISTESRGLGLISSLINSTTGLKFFYQDNKGKLTEVEIENLSFPCTKI